MKTLLLMVIAGLLALRFITQDVLDDMEVNGLGKL